MAAVAGFLDAALVAKLGDHCMMIAREDTIDGFIAGNMAIDDMASAPRPRPANENVVNPPIGL